MIEDENCVLFNAILGLPNPNNPAVSAWLCLGLVPLLSDSLRISWDTQYQQGYSDCEGFQVGVNEPVANVFS